MRLVRALETDLEEAFARTAASFEIAYPVRAARADRARLTSLLDDLSRQLVAAGDDVLPVDADASAKDETDAVVKESILETRAAIAKITNVNAQAATKVLGKAQRVGPPAT